MSVACEHSLAHVIEAWDGILVLESAPIWMESGILSRFRSPDLRLEPVSISILGLSSTHFGRKDLIQKPPVPLHRTAGAWADGNPSASGTLMSADLSAVATSGEPRLRTEDFALL